MTRAAVLLGFLALVPATAAAQPGAIQPGNVAATDVKPWAAGVAEDRQARARELHRKGNGHFERSEFTRARDTYLRALEAWNHPAIRYNLAETELALGRHYEAYTNLGLALAYGDYPLGPTLHARALQQRTLLLGKLARLHVQCEQPGVEVYLDGRYAFTGPGSIDRVVRPGPHELLASKSGYESLVHPVELGPGHTETLVVRLRVPGRTSVEDLPLAEIDRSQTLPAGIGTWKAVGVGFLAHEPNDVAYLPPVPFPVFAEYGVADWFTVEALTVVPRAIRWRLWRTDSTELAVRAGLLVLEDNPFDLFTFGGEVGYRHRLGWRRALRLRFAHSRQLVKPSVWRAAATASLLVQWTPRVSVAPKATVEVLHVPAGIRIAGVDELTEEQYGVNAPFGVDVSWSLNHRWRFDTQYEGRYLPGGLWFHFVRVQAAWYW